MSDYIVDITDQNAQQLLIDESFKRPVVVDFWAPWCEPCKTLMPLMEKLAHEFAGVFLLARVNADEQQTLAGQLGVRNLPTVMVIVDGQPVDGFSGVQTESAIREILEKYLPKPWDAQLAEATILIEAGDYNNALPLLRQACTDSRQRGDIAVQLARVLLELKRLEDAEALLEAIPMAEQDPLYHQLLAQLHLAQEAGHSAEIEALEAALNENPEDLDAAYQLAVQFSQENHQQEALALLLSILQSNRDHRDGGSKKAMLEIIATLGKGDPLAVEYQRKLFGLLY
jgi:putative thioredoxin